MVKEFDILVNLPLLIFAFLFFCIFVLFIWGGIILLRAGGTSEKIEKGRKILKTAIILFLIIALVMAVFYLVNYFLKSWETKKSKEVAGEFPASPAADFPPSPIFLKIGNYYFTGPWSLKKTNVIAQKAVVGILCKRNGDYDTLYISEVAQAGKTRLLKNRQYGCWLENCEGGSKNLYLGIYWIPKSMEISLEKKEISKKLIEQINPPCKE